MTITISTTDKGEARDLLKALDVKRVLRDFHGWLFDAVDEDQKPWGEVFQKLADLMAEHDVTLEDDYEPTCDCGAGCACGRAPTTDGDEGDGAGVGATR